MTFENLHPKIREWLEKQGYLESTLPQRMAIPNITKGKDILIIAPTGHGKTLAAVLPIFDMLLKDKDKKGIRFLYITPLKSLNRDILDRIIKLASYIGLDVDLRHGDTTKKERAQQLADPADVLISTPETLQAILIGKKFRELLRNVEYVVVDEIHELCENKRGTQLSLALERLESLRGKKFQRIGLSATVGDPKKIAKFLTSNECEIIDARAEKKYEFNVDYPKPTAEDFALAREISTTPNVAYCLRKIDRMVEESRSTIVFVNTRETAEGIGAKFHLWKPDAKIAVHHSSLSKGVRLDVEQKFKNGELKAIISTSSLELGIDVGSVDLVIQYGSPRQATKLIQRVGRSGHGVGRISKGEIICNSIDDYLEALAVVKKIEDGWLEEPTIPEKPYDVLSHQIVGICMDFQNESRTPTRDEIYKIVTKSYPYRKLSREELDSMIELMKDIHLIGEKDEGLFRTRKGMMYYFENLSMIPHERDYKVFASDLNKVIGILHQGFVAEHIKHGAQFIMKGETWRVVDVEEDKVNVVSSESGEGAVPSWEGELIPVPMEIAKLAGDLREKFALGELKKQKDDFVIPTSKRMFIESYEDYTIVHSCFGSKVNQTLSKAIGAMITSKIGSSIGVQNDAYRLLFKMPLIVGQEQIVEAMNELQPEWIDDIIKKSMKNTSMFLYRFYHVAKRFGIVDKNAEFSQYILSRLTTVYQNTFVYEEAMKELLREKLDTKSARDILEKIKSGKIEVINSPNYEISPLGVEGLRYRTSLMKPKGKIKEIYNLVKERLKNRKFWFGCLSCGNTIGVYSVKNVPENLKCPKCGAKLIGFVPYKESEIAKKILRKYTNKQKLNEEEEKFIKKFSETAEMFINYGKSAVFVLAGYGIGPRVGRRILNRYHENEDNLVKDIIKEEKRFIETRIFW